VQVYEKNRELLESVHSSTTIPARLPVFPIHQVCRLDYLGEGGLGGVFTPGLGGVFDLEEVLGVGGDLGVGGAFGLLTACFFGALAVGVAFDLLTVGFCGGLGVGGDFGLGGD